MKSFVALCAACLIAAPSFAQTTNSTATQPAPSGSDAPADKPAPTISATRGEAPAQEPAGDKPAPTEGSESDAPATPKA